MLVGERVECELEGYIAARCAAQSGEGVQPDAQIERMERELGLRRRVEGDAEENFK